MKFFNEMERKYNRYAIPNLMYYIVILYAVGLAVYVVNPVIFWRIYKGYLCLDGRAILHGQIWRLVTFLIFPPSFGSFRFTSVFFGIIALFMYHSLGQTLENVWGSFRFNVFFLMGVLTQGLACLIGYVVFKQEWMLTTGFLNSSIFLAFAMYFPDAQFLLFFVLPVKAKWLAVAESAVYLYSFIFGGAAERCELVVSLANILIFFLMTRNYRRYAPKEIRRKNNFKKETKILPKGSTRHRCAVCGRTELDGAELEFRYCSKCEGNYEYCQDHLYTHKHVTKEEKKTDV
ncbi:MAG: rhomboid family intramembrane serine protease [Lachnospiraceae bacterium]|nr:rhomboid family intramembrane serine protease [Lachnospiraceae bacterium]MCI9282448.1 rhomboid family intramembrane serine protease [Lachnospiraceae bacterium]